MAMVTKALPVTMASRALPLEGVKRATHDNCREGSTKVSDLGVVIMGKGLA